jgi:hypothetical protein
MSRSTMHPPLFILSCQVTTLTSIHPSLSWLQLLVPRGLLSLVVFSLYCCGAFGVLDVMGLWWRLDIVSRDEIRI